MAGIIAFDVADHMVDVLLDRIAKADVFQFLSHLAPIQKGK
jgi:hypothetical protein